MLSNLTAPYGNPDVPSSLRQQLMPGRAAPGFLPPAGDAPAALRRVPSHPKPPTPSRSFLQEIPGSLDQAAWWPDHFKQDMLSSPYSVHMEYCWALLTGGGSGLSLPGLAERGKRALETCPSLLWLCLRLSCHLPPHQPSDRGACSVGPPASTW